MKRSLAAFMLGLGLVILACDGGGGSLDNGTVATGPVTQQASTASGQVTATFAAASLGSDCGGGAGAPSADFAGKCAAEGPCGSPCQQSNMQITFRLTAAGGARVTVVSVTLHDSAGAQVDTLTAKTPKAWTDNTYTTWDQTIKQQGELKTTFNLTAPNWSKLGSGRSQSYVVRVVLSVDGETLTIESTPVTREPEVVT